MRNLLWVDCVAGALVGVAMLAFHEPLAKLYALPRGFVLFLGSVNLLYGSYSFSLAIRARRPRALIHLLVFANATWAIVCVVNAILSARSASPFAIAHFAGEAMFVGALAALEWRWRE